jgi:GT2 family glycosyltransferase
VIDEPTAILAGSAIIPSRERHALLADAIRALVACRPAPDEVLVIDASEHSLPGLQRLAAEAATHGVHLTYVHRPGLTGASRSRNLGAALARHDLLLYVDDDVLVGPDWAARMKAALDRAGPAGAATGRVVESEPEVAGGFAPTSGHVAHPRIVRGPTDDDPLSSGSLAIGRATLLGLGGFDERLGPGTAFPAAEDNDLGHRLLRGGAAVALEPLAVAAHRAWRSPGDLATLRWAYGRGQGAFYAKHVLAGDRHAARRFRVDLAHRVRAVGAAVLRDRSAVLARCAFAAGLVVGALDWVRQHGRSRSPGPGGLAGAGDD